MTINKKNKELIEELNKGSKPNDLDIHLVWIYR